MKTITEQLSALSEEQNLQQMTEEHLLIALKNFKEEESEEYASLFDKTKPKKIKTAFYKQSFIFHHSYLEHYYMDTEYRLSGKDGTEVGSYRLITDLNGDAVDDYLVFEA